jgi:AraC-like DNA-binding protein
VSESVLASSLRILQRVIDRYGLDANALFREVDLDPTRVNDSLARFPVEKARRLWHLAGKRIDDPCFGLQAGPMWRPTDLHALGYAFLSSTSLRTAIERVARYRRVVSDVIEFIVTVEGSSYVVTLANRRADLLESVPLEDGRWSILLRMCRAAAEPDFRPRSVWLTHDEPPCVQDYYDYFRCEVRFRAPASRIEFGLNDVKRKLTGYSQELAQINDRVLAEYIESLQQDDLVSQVKRLIVDHLPTGALTDEFVARELALSPRTLQRRLKECGLTYRLVVDEVRKTLVARYIANERMTLTEIGFLLGFAEPSSFTRAYRHWTGEAPSQTRQRMGIGE